MDAEKRDNIIKTMYLANATDAAIAFAVSLTVGRVRQIVRGMGLPLRQPQKSRLFHTIDNAPLLAELANITHRTAVARLKLARHMDLQQVEITKKNLRGIGASIPALLTLRKTLAELSIDLDAHGQKVKLLRPGFVCELTYTDLAFMVAGEKGIKSVAEKINAGWVKKDS